MRYRYNPNKCDRVAWSGYDRTYAQEYKATRSQMYASSAGGRLETCNRGVYNCNRRLGVRRHSLSSRSSRHHRGCENRCSARHLDGRRLREDASDAKHNERTRQFGASGPSGHVNHARTMCLQALREPCVRSVSRTRKPLLSRRHRQTPTTSEFVVNARHALPRSGPRRQAAILAIEQGQATDRDMSPTVKLAGGSSGSRRVPMQPWVSCGGDRRSELQRSRGPWPVMGRTDLQLAMGCADQQRWLSPKGSPLRARR